MELKGIDVSEFQTNINWSKVKEDGIKYAILRCGYGSDDERQDDAEFKRNLEECERLNIPIGVYIMSYADSTLKALSEAEHTLRLVAGHNLPLGIWYDVEDNSTVGSVSKAELTNIINKYCSIIEQAGYRVGIYSNLNWLDKKIEKSIKDKYAIWVAQYNDKCEYEGKYVLWQYTSSGKVEGINENVDMNYLYDESYLSNSNDKPEESEKSEIDRIKSLQIALNEDFKAGLEVNGVIGTSMEKTVMEHYLKYYTEGNFVRWTQTQLKRKGYDLGSYGIDGCYGRDTEKAVLEYQKDNKLVQDKCVGIEVVRSLVK